MNNPSPPIVAQLKSWPGQNAYLKNLAAFAEIYRPIAEKELGDYVATGRLIYKNPINGQQEEDLIPSRSTYLTSPMHIASSVRHYDGCIQANTPQGLALMQTAVLGVELCSLCKFLIETEFPAKFGRNLKMYSLGSNVGYLALAAAIGAMEVVERWTPLVVEAVRRGYALDGNQRGMLHFILRIWCAARGVDYPDGEYPRYEVAEGVLRIWNTPDTELLGAWLVQLCNQHTRLSASRDFMDFANEFSHFPVEVLMLFRLREQIGLSNPVVDHPIMKFPWSRLWPVQAALPDELLAGVYQRLEQDEGITVPGLYRMLLA